MKSIKLVDAVTGTGAQGVISLHEHFSSFTKFPTPAGLHIHATGAFALTIKGGAFDSGETVTSGSLDQLDGSSSFTLSGIYPLYAPISHIEVTITANAGAITVKLLAP